MNCPVCKYGSLSPGNTSVTLSRGPGVTIVFKDVPAQVCDNCGEAFVAEVATADLLRQADQAARSGVSVEVRSYIRAA